MKSACLFGPFAFVQAGMKDNNSMMFSEDPPLFMLKHLTVRALEPEEFKKAGELLDREHYLGDLPTGRQLLQVVEYKGHWVALLDWGPASLKLAGRDQRIGWTPQQRAQRLGLIVQNRRFLILGEKRIPNLASRALGLALKALPDHWHTLYGYRPLLAETFTDIERYAGTCYKATNWEALGQTKGFGRHGADFFIKHERPKLAWIKSLNRNSWRILTSMDVPKDYQCALNNKTAERDLALNKAAMLDLRTHFQQHFTDPRRGNRTYPASSLLVFVSMALFAGRHSITTIQRYGHLLNQQQRAWLDFPCKKGTRFRKTPSWRALHNFLTQIDVPLFADCLNRWLSSHMGTLPRALAVDGKWVRDRVLSLCLCEHETGAAAAIGFAKEVSKTDANKREGEQTVALHLYENTNLEGATVTGDALNNNKAQAHAVLDSGGDYFFQLKNENRHAWKNAKRIAAQGSPLLSTPKNPTSDTDASTNAP
jgi:hypothetical protein